MYLRRNTVVSIATALLLLSGSCKDVVAPAPVASISPSSASIELVPDEVEHVSATPRDAAGNPLTRPIEWTSSAPDIATAANGQVTGHAIGSAVVTASAEGIKTDITVTVTDGAIVTPAGKVITSLGGQVGLEVPSAAVSQPSRVVISAADPPPVSARLVRGTAVSLRTQSPLAHAAVLIIRYDPAKTQGTAESGLRINKMTATGWVEVPDGAVDTETNRVRGSITDAGVYGILIQASVAKVSVTPSSPTLKAGDDLSLKAVLQDADASALSGRSIAWSSSAPGVLDVDQATGVAIAKSPGTAVVTATSEGVSGTASVTVTPGDPDAVSIVEGNGQIADTSSAVPVAPSVRVTDRLGFGVPGITVSFSVTSGGGSVTPASAITNADGVASVTRWVLGATQGPNAVTASISGGKSVVFDATASKPPPPVASVTVTPQNPTIQVGQTLAFSASAKDAGGNDLAGRKVSWSVSNSGVLQIDASTGAATGVAPGSATVTASIEGKSASSAATVVPGPATRIFVVAGDQQTADINSAVAVAPSVRVNDKAGFAIVGATVSFAVTGGGGSVTPSSVSTDATGTATVSKWVLGSTPGGNSLTATVAGAGSVTLTATATQQGPPPPIAMAISAGQGQTANAFSNVPVAPAVKVTDAVGNPVAGVVVTFTVGSGGGTVSGATPATNAQGIATVGSWTLGDVGTNTLIATRAGLSGNPLTFTATALQGVRIVTFGDSNTDAGYSGTNPTPVALSYVSSDPARAPPEAPNNSTQLAGKIETKWKAAKGTTTTAVNHGISGTGSGTGRTGATAPNAREAVNGVTRFEAEVLGMGYPWSGAESGANYPIGSILRRKSFIPSSSDFVYVSIGTNDFAYNLNATQSAANISWMIDQWVNAGHPASKFILTTLAPRAGSNGSIPPLNDQIRAIAAARGVGLIDICARTSDDNGATWRSSADNIGDQIHYSEPVRDWIADQVVSYMIAHP